MSNSGSNPLSNSLSGDSQSQNGPAQNGKSSRDQRRTSQRKTGQRKTSQRKTSQSDSGPGIGEEGGRDRQQNRRQRLTLGQLGEDLTADWLRSQGGKILEQRWRCRRGELDLVALMPEGRSKFVVVFVEVKTRSRRGWDESGLLSLTPAKQRKLWHSARLYLSQTPRYAPLPCRFDLALIGSQRQKLPQKKAAPSNGTQLQVLNLTSQTPTLGQPVERGGYRLTLQHYLTDAFRLE